MPVELRKRKAPAPPPEPAPAPVKRKTTKPKATAASKAKAAASKLKEAAKPRGRPAKAKADDKKPAAETTDDAAANGETGPVKPAVGSILSLDDFGGEVEFNEGGKTTLKKLVEESKTGVVLFTYPKASTPGCKFFFYLCCGYK